jgi:hypothetical protein
VDPRLDDHLPHIISADNTDAESDTRCAGVERADVILSPDFLMTPER